MRTYFEDQFDRIRRESNEHLHQVRERRDDCAQRVCDLVDKQAEVCVMHMDMFHSDLRSHPDRAPCEQRCTSWI